MQKIEHISVIQLRNIRPQKRYCCNCGYHLYGRTDQYITEIGRGKYLCRVCRDELERKVRSKDERN